MHHIKDSRRTSSAGFGASCNQDTRHGTPPPSCRQSGSGPAAQARVHIRRHICSLSITASESSPRARMVRDPVRRCAAICILVASELAVDTRCQCAHARRTCIVLFFDACTATCCMLRSHSEKRFSYSCDRSQLLGQLGTSLAGGRAAWACRAGRGWGRVPHLDVMLICFGVL